MTRAVPIDPDEGCPTPTNADRQRVGALLSTVSSRTLLQTLASLCQHNDDACLIIVALIDRVGIDGSLPAD